MGHTSSTEVADVVYPILTESKKPYAFGTRDTTLVLTDTKDKTISLTVLLKAVFKVEFAGGTSDDPNFGGYLITPTDSRVALYSKTISGESHCGLPPYSHQLDTPCR